MNTDEKLQANYGALLTKVDQCKRAIEKRKAVLESLRNSPAGRESIEKKRASITSKKNAIQAADALKIDYYRKEIQRSQEKEATDKQAAQEAYLRDIRAAQELLENRLKKAEDNAKHAIDHYRSHINRFEERLSRQIDELDKKEEAALNSSEEGDVLIAKLSVDLQALEKDAQDTKAMITDAQKKKEKRDKEFELERKRSEAIQAKMEEERARKRTILTEPDSGSDSDSDKETNAIVCTTSLSDEETKHQFITDRDKIIDDFFESDRWAKMIPTEQKKYLDLIDLHCYNTPIEQQSLDAFKKIFKV